MTKGVLYPVFYDPSKRRWKRFKILCLTLLSGLALVFGVLIASTLVDPDLPHLALRSLHNHDAQQPVTPAQAPVADAAPPSTESGHPFGLMDAHASVLEVTRPEVIGFYVNWDDNSFTSLKQNISKLDRVIGEWLYLSGSDGRIGINDPGKRKETVSYIKQQRPDLPIVPLINNFASKQMLWDSELIKQTLSNPMSRKKLIAELLNFVRGNDFAGISIDFENIPPSSQPHLVAFMSELYGVFHPLGLEVSQSVPPDDPSFDLRALSQANDYVILMAYDEFASSSKPGPVASRSWFNEHVQRALRELPADKVVIGIGSYGYDWQEGNASATTVSFQEILKLAQRYQAQSALDPQTLNPGFSYTDEKGQAHRVWYLDAVTAFNQLQSLQPGAIKEKKRLHPRGFALWRLGTEDPLLWEVFNAYPRFDATSARQLERIHYGYDLEYRGRGEVLKVSSEPTEGRRALHFDPASGLIELERILTYPTPYVISRWGPQSTKQVTITFDDGPDVNYTPQILDILKRYGVKATFFVIGQNANREVALLQRMEREGHTIGNHTFLHSLPSTLSANQLRMELTASTRLLESYLGRRSLLFRPPYGEDIEPATPGHVDQLAVTGRLGYYTVGMHVDPDDWRRPGVDRIVEDTISQVVQGLGNVILLHDGGGDRNQTIAALPRIIEGLRERGFTLSGMPELIGLSRNDLMPRLLEQDSILANVNGLGFRLIGGFSAFVFYVFLAAIILSFARLLLIVSLALYEYLRARPQCQTAYHPSVTVVVPAFNEEKVIVETVRALLRADYDELVVMVVDDGSSDDTYANATTMFGEHPRVRVLRKPNEGKSHALNFALRQISTDIVVTIDADTVLAHGAVTRLVGHFADPRVAAVAGNIKVGNRRNLLTRWQALEYIVSQNLERRAMALLNCIFVVPGAIGAWRVAVLHEAGGFTDDTLAEDADLTLTVLRLGYKVEYDQQALAFTEAPDTVSGLLRQRYRWTYGVLQAAWKHRATLLRIRYKGLGMFAIPNVLILQVSLTLVSPFIDLLMLTSVADAAWRQIQDPSSLVSGELSQLFLYYLTFLAVDFLACGAAFALERKEQPGLLVWLIPQRFFYRQLMYVAAIRSLLKAIQGSPAWWGSVERKATVQKEAQAKQ